MAGVHRLALPAGQHRSADMVLRSAIPVAEGHRREHQYTDQEVAFERGRSTVSQRPRSHRDLQPRERNDTQIPRHKTPAESFRQKLLAQIRRTSSEQSCGVRPYRSGSRCASCLVPCRDKSLLSIASRASSLNPPRLHVMWRGSWNVRLCAK